MEPGKTIGPPQPAPVRTQPGQVKIGADPSRALRPAAGIGEAAVGAGVIGDGPRVFQPFPAGAPDGIELLVGEELGVDAEVSAEFVEKDMHHFPSRLGAGARQWFAAACPFVVVGGELVHALIGQAQLSGLFQVGHGDTPAPLEVGPQAIGDDIAQRAGDLLPRDVLVGGLLVAGEELEALPAERFHHFGPEVLVGEWFAGVLFLVIGWRRGTGLSGSARPARSR